MKLFFFFLSHFLLVQQYGIGCCFAGAAEKATTQHHTASSSRLGYTSTTNTSRQLQSQGQGGGNQGGGGGGGGGGPKTFETSGLSVQILGQSGKFIASNGNSKVQVTMDGLYERDENGNLVGNTGSTKHSINTFATTDFTFDAEETVQLLEVTNDDGNVTQQVSAEGLRVDFYTTLDTNSKLLVQANLVSKEGLAGDDGGNWTVSPGDFKFNIELSDWEWCDPCSNDQYGAFVDLDIEIKELNSDSSNHQPVLKRDRNQTFDLGGDGSSAATLELSHKFMVKKGTSSGAGSANMVSFMPEGYPKVTTSGDKTLFTFRFSKFDKDSTAKYDPIIKFSSTSDSSSAASTTATSGKVFGGMFGLVSGLLTYYNVFY
jgi:hypothetical protein